MIWGPRLLLFLNEQECRQLGGRLHSTLADRLPPTFLGYPTNFSAPDPDDNGTQQMVAVDSGSSHQPQSHCSDAASILY